MNIKNIKFIGALVTLALVSTGMGTFDTASTYADDWPPAVTQQAPVVVSLGDSFSSGEGIAPFYGQDSDNKYQDYDWLAHRSQGSWAGQLTFTRNGETVTLSEQKGTSWYFVADSGAKLAQLTSVHTKKPTRKNGNACESLEEVKLPQQLAVFDDNNLTGKVDYVTITLGGNDVGFSEVVTAAVTNPTGLQAILDEQWANWESTIKPTMIASYELIRDKAGPDAHIIVAGYPLLFNPKGGTVQLGSLSMTINAETAGVINDNVQRFNEEIETIVKGFRGEGDANFHFVSVEEVFSGHEAYTEDPYINPVMTLQAEDIKQCNSSNPLYSLITPSAYSLHPNSDGAAAYASAVQAVIDEIEAFNALYSVSFDGNGADTGSMAEMSDHVDVSLTLPENAFARTGYVFTGWNTKADGTGTAYADGAEFTVPAANTTLYAQWVEELVEIYRVYDGVEHLYVNNMNERDVLVKSGWTYEGIAFYTPKSSSTEVHRLYQPRTGDHHYTSEANEIKVLTGQNGWVDEGVLFYADDAKRAELKRLFHSGLGRGEHLHTADANEQTVLSTQYGWEIEGISFYVAKYGE